AWADRFKLELVESSDPPRSWFYDALLASRLFASFRSRARGLLGRIDERTRITEPRATGSSDSNARRTTVRVLWVVAGVGLAYGAVRAATMLVGMPGREWGQIAIGTAATLLRVMSALAIAVAWTVPLGVAIGFNPRLARWFQPIVQIAASVP